MNNDLISREALNKTIDGITWYHINSCGELVEGAFDDDDAFYKAEDIYNAIDNAPTVEPEKVKESEIINAYTKGFEAGVETVTKKEIPQCKDKLIECFNKYDVLLVHLDGKIVPVKNTSKQECYNLLYDIQELIEWRRLLFKKYHR